MVDAPLAHFHYVEADIRLAARLHDEPAGDVGITAALVRSTASAGVPYASDRRALTSQKTTVCPSRATMSASPKGVL